MGCSCAEGVVVDHRTRMSARNDFAGHVTSTMSVEVPVRGRSVLVAGSSGQAMTVTGSLVGAGAVVTVICTDPTPYLSDMADRGLIAFATHRGLTQGFTVISGHVPPGDPESTVNYAALAQANTTIVLMMAVANLDAITSALIDAGMSVQTPVAVIADGSLSSQRVVRSTLDAIAAAAAGIGPPATAVIGAVAGFVPGRTANLPAVELNVR